MLVPLYVSFFFFLYQATYLKRNVSSDITLQTRILETKINIRTCPLNCLGLFRGQRMDSVYRKPKSPWYLGDISTGFIFLIKKIGYI